MTSAERDEIVARARIASHPPMPVSMDFVGMIASSIIGAGLLIWLRPYLYFYFRFRLWRDPKLRWLLMQVAGSILLTIVVGIGGALYVLFRWEAMSEAMSDFKVAGGFVFDHRIFLQREHLKKLAQNEDELVCVLDHELTHFFRQIGTWNP